MPGSRFRHLLVAGALAALVAGAGACSTEDAGPSETPFPDDLTAYVDQSRVERIGRSVFVRLVHEGEGTVTVTRAEVDSERFEPVTWTGEKTFMNEADLDFELPPGRCGTGSDADVRLTYRLDDGPELVSTTRATDRYGAIGLFLDRDCSEQVMAEAAVVTVGEPRIVGTGRTSTFQMPVSFEATGEREDVAFAGFGGTVLFSLAAGTRAFPGATGSAMTAGRTVSTILSVLPGRCDPHALAEDKVGTLFYVHVTGPGLPEGASYYLPLPDETRGDLRGFFAFNCGL